MSEPIKVAIVEDDKRLREGLTFPVNSTSEFRCVGALMDINLPNSPASSASPS